MLLTFPSTASDFPRALREIAREGDDRVDGVSASDASGGSSELRSDGDLEIAGTRDVRLDERSLR